jgi:PAS domain S-box-containing protein
MGEREQPRRRTALRDLLWVLAAVLVVLGLGLVTDASTGLVERVHGTLGSAEDGLLGGLLLAVVGLAAFAVLRWRVEVREQASRVETETRYRALVERMPAVPYTRDPRKPAGAVAPLFLGPQVDAILGFTAEEWHADPGLWARQIHPDDRERVLAASARADRTGEPLAVEYRHRRKDGAEVWIRAEALVVERDTRGRPSLVQGFMYDITHRRQAEESARETEERFRMLVEQVPAVTYTWDPAAEPGTVSAPYVSPQIEHLLGYSAEEWRDDPMLWHSRIHDEDRERVLERWNLAVRTRTAFRAEYRISTRDGRLVWLRDEAVPVSGEGARPRLYQGVMYDVTDRKRAEGQLLEAQERFRTLVEQIPAVVYVEDPQSGRNLYISPQVETMFGYTPEEWLADSGLWESRLHPEDRDRVVAENEDASTDRWSIEYRTIHRDGHVMWIQNEAVLIRDRDGNPLVWQGVAFDVTEHKIADERLRQAEETYRTLVEQLPVVVYQDAVDDQRTALYVSPHYERLFGYPPEARLHDPGFWIDHLHPEDRDRVLAESERTNATGEPFVAEYRFLARDGRVVWVRDEAVLLGGSEGQPRRWQGVLMDVTERKLAEETLSRRDAILEAVGFAAERFLRSHEPSEVLSEVLERLGEAAGVSRVYVFETETLEDGTSAMTVRSEWLADGVGSLDEPSNHRMPYRDGFARWEAALSSGHPIVGLVSDLPVSERTALRAESVRSLAVVPVFVGETWWGYLGFDDCLEDRAWPVAEVEALKAAADTLGAAIGRARAAQLQAETEQRYRVLVEQMPAVTYVHDAGPGGTVRYVSPQVYALLGYEPGEQELTHALWMSSIHPDDRDRVAAEDARTDRTGEPFDLEYRQIRRDGRVIWVRDSAVLVHGDDGEPLYWQGVRFDVTARKEAEEHLREAEERYRTLVETLTAVIYIDRVDMAMSTLYVSPQIESMFGYSAEDWIGDTDLWLRNVYPDDLEAAVAAIERHNVDGVPLDVEYRFRAADGSWRWVRDQATVLRDEHGAPLVSQGLMSDITTLKETQEQLRETEARYRALVEHIPAILYVDPLEEHAPSVYVGPQIEEVVGVTQDAYLADGDLWRQLIHPEDRDRVVEAYREQLAARTGWQIEYRVCRPDDGRVVWIRDESAFLPGSDGGAGFVQGVMTDVTERKLAEEALRESERREREAAERLRALDEMKNTFLAAVSHELRSPLTSILGLSLTLEQTHLSEEDQADLLGRLAANARKLDRLLKDLLDIDRLNRGIVTPNYRPTDIGALVRRAVESLDVLGERPILVEAEPVTIEADPAKVERIVENLLANAARHTGPDRAIWVRVWAEPHGAIVAVEDDGPGVPRELQQVIFEPFRQGPTASPHAPGTGIGLSLVAMFAELHGGRAWVQDRDGGGASFRVFLPAIPAAPSAMAPPIGLPEAG